MSFIYLSVCVSFIFLHKKLLSVVSLYSVREHLAVERESATEKVQRVLCALATALAASSILTRISYSIVSSLNVDGVPCLSYMSESFPFLIFPHFPLRTFSSYSLCYVVAPHSFQHLVNLGHCGQTCMFFHLLLLPTLSPSWFSICLLA